MMLGVKLDSMGLEVRKDIKPKPKDLQGTENQPVQLGRGRDSR